MHPIKITFEKWANSGPSFVYFCLFLQNTIQIQIDKSVDGVLGIRTRAAEWNVYTHPLSYGGTPITMTFRWIGSRVAASARNNV